VQNVCTLLNRINHVLKLICQVIVVVLAIILIINREVFNLYTLYNNQKFNRFVYFHRKNANLKSYIFSHERFI